jgi:hypothetical protein
MNRRNGWAKIIVGVFMGVLFSAAVLLAGNLEPGVGPTAGTMHTLLLGLRAPVPKTGQTTSYATGDDGALQKGVAWPNPRFTDNADGTVTDNLTGLIWLKNANCFGLERWAQAVNDANNLEGVTRRQCGLIDGSMQGQWRLPNVKELQSLIDFAYFGPPLSNTAGTGQWTEGDPFTGVPFGVNAYYWSSTTYTNNTGFAWTVFLVDGAVSAGIKTTTSYVWPVRGGQFQIYLPLVLKPS